MPKIEVFEDPFYALLGKKLTENELIDLLVVAKGELDGRDAGEGLLKIELNDTNRPDLWSTSGLARQLRCFLTDKTASYDFFSRPGKLLDAGDRVVEVADNLRGIRPYITAFMAKGAKVDDALLVDIIQGQEKLCENFGRRRKAVAMGVYRADLIQFPVRYRAADPDATRFVPLGIEKELSLREILQHHPKGVDYGAIVSDFKLFPYLEDRNGGTLSFPPIINSARIGAVEVGDCSFFIELTGLDLDTLMLAASIAACDLADLGFSILPVKVQYPYDTPYGREIVTPFYFQKEQTLEPAYAGKLLGEKMSAGEIRELLQRAGHQAEVRDDRIVLYPPPYRNDFLHAADIVEEVMIARGMDSFEPVMPHEYTIGRLSEMETFSRDVRDIMVGLGFQEMIYNYLGSRKDFIHRMEIDDTGFIEIANPMTENYAVVRKSILPCLLSSESVSANAVYPHRIFEIGKVVFEDSSDNYGSVSRTNLGFLFAGREAGFNDVNSHISALIYYLGRDYNLQEGKDPRFIKGRTGEIVCAGRKVGVMGEIHPNVLDNWGIQMPCACAELDLELLLE
jgi:phenylalanyl-tRNA synthetase beta chain